MQWPPEAGVPSGIFASAGILYHLGSAPSSLSGLRDDLSVAWGPQSVIGSSVGWASVPVGGDCRFGGSETYCDDFRLELRLVDEFGAQSTPAVLLSETVTVPMSALPRTDLFPGRERALGRLVFAGAGTVPPIDALFAVARDGTVDMTGVSSSGAPAVRLYPRPGAAGARVLLTETDSDVVLAATLDGASTLWWLAPATFGPRVDVGLPAGSTVEWIGAGGAEVYALINRADGRAVVRMSSDADAPVAQFVVTGDAAEAAVAEDFVLVVAETRRADGRGVRYVATALDLATLDPFFETELPFAPGTVATDLRVWTLRDDRLAVSLYDTDATAHVAAELRCWR